MDLNCCLDLKKEIGRRERRLDELRGLASSAGTSRPTDDGLRRTCNQSSRVENLAVKIIELEHELDALNAGLKKSSGELTAEILRLVGAGLESGVLILRYVGLKKFREVAAAMRLPLRRVFNLHCTGREKFFARQNL